MNYTKEEYKNYTLHIYQTKKFKKVDISLFLSNNIKGKASYRSLLNNVLGQSSKKYDTKRKLAIALEDNYNPIIDFSSERLANVYLSRFNISYYNKEYIGEDLQEEISKMLYELVYNPNVNDESFEENSFKIAKEKYLEFYKIKKENNHEIASDEFYKLFDKEGPLAENPLGELDILNEINASSLYQYYKQFIANSKVDIFVVGDVDIDVTKKIIANYFDNIPSVKSFEFALLERSKKDLNEVISEKDSLQNISIVAYEFKGLNSYENQIVLKLYNAIFGGEVFSRLFNIVREKHSLCYSIGSRSSSFDNYMMVMISYSKEKYDKTINLIEEIKKTMSQSITDEELTNAKATLLADLKKVFNNSNLLAKTKYYELYFNIYPLDEYENLVDKVRREDILALNDKIVLDTIYTLGGKSWKK